MAAADDGVGMWHQLKYPFRIQHHQFGNLDLVNFFEKLKMKMINIYRFKKNELFARKIHLMLKKHFQNISFQKYEN